MQRIVREIVILILAANLLVFFSCKKKEDGTSSRTLEDELEELNSFILRKEADGYDIDTTDLGIYYIIKQEGEGPTPVQGDTCSIDYLSYFMNGTLFESSNDYFPNGIWNFIYKEADMIAGLRDGVGHMNTGSTCDIIIPSPMAYGAKGSGLIPPYSTLIYVVNMIDLRPVED